MNDSRQPTDPADDRALDEYLAGDSAVSQAYAGARNETAPRELDDKIKAAARSKISSKSASGDKPRRSRRRWMQPMAAVATLVLGVALVLDLLEDQAVVPGEQVESRAPEAAEAPTTLSDVQRSQAEPQGRPEETQGSGGSPSRQDSSEQSTVTARDKAPRKPEAIAPRKQPPVAPPPEPAAPEPAAKPQTESAAGQRSAPPSQQQAESAAPETASQPSAAPPKAESPAQAEPRLGEQDIAPQPEPAPQSQPDLSYRESPRVWLSRIIYLEDSGQRAQAASELRELKQRYPETPIPGELRGLLQPATE